MTKADGSPLEPGEIGELGERIACAWLRANGCKVLYRNFRGPKGGELDIVARDGRVLAFVEVKTRTGSWGRPLDAVDEEKRRLIRRGANAWLHLLGTREVPWRFDVAEVSLRDGCKPRVNLVKNAF